MTVPPPGWYPDPEDANRARYWDGATWMPQATSTSRERNGSGLTVTRGVCLILLALLFGVIAVRALPEGPTHWSRYATEFADTVWRIYFGTVLALCVAALILGIHSLTRPSAHPMYSVIAGVAMVVVGVAGGVLGYLSVTDVEDMGTPLAYMGFGLLIALGGGIATLLSAIVLAAQRRSQRWVPAAVLQSGEQPGTLGLRFLARLIDYVLVGIVAVPLAALAEKNIATTGLFPGLLLGLLAFVFFVAFEVSRGWTPGKRLLGLRVHGPADAAKPTVHQAAIRNSFTLLAIVPVIGEVLVLVAGIVIAATIQSSPTSRANTTSSPAALWWSSFLLRRRTVGPEQAETSLAQFVRARDLACRFPGCDKAAQFCDVDHTVPWPVGRRIRRT